MPLRWHLVLLVACTLLPVLFFEWAVTRQLSQDAQQT
jgi:hypothetical protein